MKFGTNGQACVRKRDGLFFYLSQGVPDQDRFRKGDAIMDSSITLDNCRPNLIDYDSGNVYYVSALNLIDCRPNIMYASVTFLHQIFLLLLCSGLIHTVYFRQDFRLVRCNYGK